MDNVISFKAAVIVTFVVYCMFIEKTTNVNILYHKIVSNENHITIPDYRDRYSNPQRIHGR